MTGRGQEPAPRLPLRGTPPPRVDLHSHSNLSDGVLSPSELVRRAAGAGVGVLALTDHDTVEGIAEAEAEAGRCGLHLLPGVEVSSRIGERNLHVLAYFAPGACPTLASWQAERRRARTERLEQMVARLAELGLPVDEEDLLAGADPRGNPGRPHVARALVAAGHVATVQEAFDRYLGAGGPAYVQDRVPDAARAIAMIRELGGLAVAAHPGVDDLDPVLEELAGLGLAGVEAFHGAHDDEATRHFQRRARALGLLVTGGSDFHAPPEDGEAEDAPGRDLGGVGPPPDEWERFARALLGPTPLPSRDWAGRRPGEVSGPRPKERSPTDTRLTSHDGGRST